MSSWRQPSRDGRPASSAGLTICARPADDLQRRGVIRKDDPGSSAGTTMGRAARGTVRSMRSLLSRAWSMDPEKGDALLAVVFLLEQAFELAAFFPGPRPHLGLAIGCELVLAGGLAVRRRAPVVAAVLGIAGLCAF